MIPGKLQARRGRTRRFRGDGDDGHARSVTRLVTRRNATLEAELAIGATTAERLREGQAHYSEAQEIAGVGSWDLDLACARLSCSPELRRIYGLEPGASVLTLERFVESILPEDRKTLLDALAEAGRSVGCFTHNRRIVRPDGAVRMIHCRGRSVAGPSGRPTRVTGTSQDVTERVDTERALERQSAELERSNEELRQFAYVASHDLQEPLRTVAAFTELLRKRYAGRLDADADEMLGFAADGAKHMQALIAALLTYFRVDRRELEPRAVDSGAVLRGVVADLHELISETGAKVVARGLPRITADPALLADLFLNLIENAIKYRGRKPPRIRIGAVLVEGEWLFTVRDNGLGIAPRHHARIFLIFQRLHTHDEYPGTGIGLSICKKIVERHGGRLWVESVLGRGAAFKFTIPVEAQPRGPRAAEGAAR